MLNEWLASRTPPPPPRLRARLDEVMEAIAANPSDPMPRALVESASAILRDTVARSSNDRNAAAALELLAADALITYAVEAATEDCERFVVLTDEMIRRLSAVAVEGRAEAR